MHFIDYRLYVDYLVKMWPWFTGSVLGSVMLTVFLLFKIMNYESSPAASPARAPSPGPEQVTPARRRQRILISAVDRRPAGPAPKRRRVTAGRPCGLRDEAYISGKFNCNVVDP